MTEFIIQEVHKYFSKALNRFSDQLKANVHELQIRLYLDSRGEPAYQLCLNQGFVQELTIKDILGYKFLDVKGYSLIMPPFIKKTLAAFVESMASQNINVLVYMCRADEDNESVDLFLYDGAKFVRPLPIEEFVPAEISIPQN